jgi:ABC-type amino acid transport substrate-binding protein
MIMKQVGESDCAPSGFVAEKDTTLDCTLGKFELKATDTFLIENGKGVVHNFKCVGNDLHVTDKKISVGFEPDAPPMYYKEGGKETGFDYELVKAIVKEVFPNAEMRVSAHEYDQLPMELAKKNIDIVAGGYVADNELKNVDWTATYLSFGYCLVTHLGQASAIKDLRSLEGKTIGVYDDGETEDWVKKNVPNVGKIVKKIDNADKKGSDWMSILQSREVDAVIYDYPFAAREVKDYNGDLVITNKCLNAPTDMKAYSFGIRCNNTEVLKRMNEAIENYKSSAAFGNLVAQFIPNPDAGRTVAPVEVKDKGSLYEVKTGETLSMIAQAHLGDKNRYKEIYDLNAGILASPDIIYVGTFLKMPNGWKH